jgi:hypothetical protein
MSYQKWGLYAESSEPNCPQILTFSMPIQHSTLLAARRKSSILIPSGTDGLVTLRDRLVALLSNGHDKSRQGVTQ